MKKWIICFLLLLGTGAYAEAQPTEAVRGWHVKLEDGGKLSGIVLWQNTDSLRLRTGVRDTALLAWNSIRWLRRLRIDPQTLEIMPATHPAQNLYGTNATAIGVPKGEAYYRSTMLFYNEFDFGVTEHLSVAVVTVPPFALGTHVRLHTRLLTDGIHIGVGALALGAWQTVWGEGVQLLSVGAGYGMVTFGDRSRNLSLSAGWMLDSDAPNNAVSPYLNVSGSYQFTPRTQLFLEFYRRRNQFFFGTAERNDLYIIGGRTAWRRVGFGYGLCFIRNRFNGTFSSTEFFGFPSFSLSVRLGKLP